MSKDKEGSSTVNLDCISFRGRSIKLRDIKCPMCGKRLELKAITSPEETAKRKAGVVSTGRDLLHATYITTRSTFTTYFQCLDGCVESISFRCEDVSFAVKLGVD